MRSYYDEDKDCFYDDDYGYYDEIYYDNDDYDGDSDDDWFGYPKKEKIKTTPKPKPLTENEILLNNIKKIKSVNNDDVYELIEKLINTKNKKIADALQEKLEYLGVNWYTEIDITNTTDSNQLKKDVILSFSNLNFDSDTDLNLFKFVITKIKHFAEWENYFDGV